MILPGKYSQLTEVEEEEEKYDVRQNLKTFKEDENDDQWDFRKFWMFLRLSVCSSGTAWCSRWRRPWRPADTARRQRNLSEVSNTTIQQYSNTNIQRYTDTTMQHYNDTTIQLYNNTTIQQYNNTTLQPYSNATIQLYKNTLMQKYNNRRMRMKAKWTFFQPKRASSTQERQMLVACRALHF